jgi:hypothetical protein
VAGLKATKITRNLTSPPHSTLEGLNSSKSRAWERHWVQLAGCLFFFGSGQDSLLLGKTGVTRVMNGSSTLDGVNVCQADSDSVGTEYVECASYGEYGVTWKREKKEARRFRRGSTALCSQRVFGQRKSLLRSTQVTLPVGQLVGHHHQFLANILPV